MKELFGKKWILHIALALCLVLAFVPVITHYASAGTAVASVTIGDTTTEYDSLEAALLAVENCTAEDQAVVKILQSFTLTKTHKVNSGVFTIDLNGQRVDSYIDRAYMLVMNGVNVTITDSGEGGTIYGDNGPNKFTRGISVTDSVLKITGGTIDGYYTITATNSEVTVSGGTVTGYWHALSATSGTVNITGGTVDSDYRYGVQTTNSEVTISGGSIRGTQAVECSGGTLTISGGTIEAYTTGGTGVTVSNCIANISCDRIWGGYSGISIWDNSNVTIRNSFIDGNYNGISMDGASVTIVDSTVRGGRGCGVRGNQTSLASSNLTIENSNIYNYGYEAICLDRNTTLTIIGGNISGNGTDIRGGGGVTVKLKLGRNGVGPTFPGGISVYDSITLASILDEDLAYWKNEQKVVLKDGQTEITGGDVVVMSANPHEHSAETYTNNGEDHTFTCTTCGKEITEPHSYDDTTLLCPCGAVSAEAVALVSKNGIPTSAYITLNDAILAVAECTAEDEAVVKILQNIELGKEILWVYGGVFTLDLNGQQISSENENGIILSGEEIVVTILDSGEGGSINSTAGICLKVFKADLIVDSGNIIGLTHGIYAANNGSITVNGGSIVGGNYGVLCNSGDITITGGNIESGGSGVSCGSGDVTITGGNIIADSYTVYCSGSNVNITDGIFTGDEGIYITEGQLTISGGQIDSNGDGIWARNGSTVAMSGGSIWAEQCGISVTDSTLFISGGSIVTNKVTYTGTGISIDKSAVTITGGTIVGVTTGINIREGTLTMEGGTVSGNDGVKAAGGTITVSGGYITAVNGFGIDASALSASATRIGSNLNVSGGTIVATNVGVAIYEHGTCVISGGTIESDNVGVLAYRGTMTISGGSIYGKWSDIRDFENTVVLTWGKNGVGATFPGGIDVDYTTLAALLNEATGYWQCTGFVEVTEEQTEILGCDVMVMNVNVTFGIKGDLDGDGDVDAEDLTILARYVAGIITDWEEDED